MSVHRAKTQISLGIRPVWSESSLSAWRKLGSLSTYWVHSEDSDQTGRMPRLICVFAGRTITLLVLSWGGSFFAFFSRFVRSTKFKGVIRMDNRLLTNSVNYISLSNGSNSRLYNHARDIIHAFSNKLLFRLYWNQTVGAIGIILFFFRSNLHALKIFVTLFSGTERPTKLKLGTHMDSGLCIVYTGIRLQMLICQVISSLFFLFKYQTWRLSSPFSRLRGLQSWNLIVSTKVRLLMLTCLFFFFFFYFPTICTHLIFCHIFTEELWDLESFN